MYARTSLALLTQKAAPYLRLVWEMLNQVRYVSLQQRYKVACMMGDLLVQLVAITGSEDQVHIGNDFNFLGQILSKVS